MFYIEKELLTIHNLFTSVRKNIELHKVAWKKNSIAVYFSSVKIF